jgi:hypothetical protein
MSQSLLQLYKGASGASGVSGYAPGAAQSGYSGTSGQSGYSGASGASGTSGQSGYSGVSATSGLSGTAGPTNNFQFFQPSNPAAKTTGMRGLGSTCKRTPTNSGVFLILFSADVFSANGPDVITIEIRYGTGTAPINGAAATGTVAGKIMTFDTTNSANIKYNFGIAGIASGLTLSTQYWIDLNMASSLAANLSPENFGVTVIEI